MGLQNDTAVYEKEKKEIDMVASQNEGSDNNYKLNMTIASTDN